MFVAPDVFLLPEDQGKSFILYAPLIGVVMHVSHGVGRLLDRLRAGPDQPLGPEDAAALAHLEQAGVVAARPYPELAPRQASDTPFDPTTVSLFLTSRCNLGCTYCYANANESPKSMTWPVARKALDLVLDNAARLGRTAAVVLHGGGEATLEWELLQQIVAHMRAETAARGLGCHLSIGTNGVMNEARARWLAGAMDEATVSVDGPPDAHDRARPTVGGGPSYEVVLRTLRIFDEVGLSYGVRMTVTSAWVDRLPEAVASIADACRVVHIQAEPVFPVGRAEGHDAEVPAAQRFVAAFRSAAEVARARGRRLSYSGARLGVLTDRFCEAAGRSFAVTPEGAVSSCYEISDDKDERADVFFWGRFDPATQRFELDEDRRRKQTRLSVWGKPHCQSCFCKWHCAGDCSAKLAQLGDATDTARNPRCEVNRALTRDQLVRALKHGPDVLAEARAVCDAGTGAP